MGKIKSIKSWVHDEGEIFMKSYTEFDINGNEIVKELYFGPNDLETKTISRFDEKNQLLEEINFGEDNEETDRSVFERDEEGKLIKTTLTFADGSQTIKSYLRENEGKDITILEESDEGEFESKEKIFFNEEGNIIKRISIDENESILEQFEYEYNDDKDLVKEISYQDNYKVSETRFIYDENKNLIKRITLNKNGETIDWALYTYDENGKNIEQQYGDYSLYKMEYNEKGLIVNEQKVNAMGVVDYIKKYRYNDQDVLIEENELNSKITFEYEYHS